MLPSGAVVVADTSHRRLRLVTYPPTLLACDSTWHHAALASSPTRALLTGYLDGAAAFAVPAHIVLPARGVASTLRIGWSDALTACVGGGGASSSDPPGALADVRIYSRALSAAEVPTLMKAPLRVVNTAFSIYDQQYAPVGIFVGNVLANPGDVVRVTPPLVLYDAPPAFAIDALGNITVARTGLDAYVKSVYTVGVNVTDEATFFFQNVSITLMPSPRPPTCVPQALNVSEAAAPGTPLSPPLNGLQVQGQAFTYALTDPAGRFEVNANTGVVSVAAGAAFNFGAQSVYSTYVTLTTTATGLSTNPPCAVVISVIETNKAPAFTQPFYNVTIAQGSAPGAAATAVGQSVGASDPNVSPTLNRVSYTLTACSPYTLALCPFRVDPVNGSVAYSGAGPLAYDASLVYSAGPSTSTLTVRADDNAVPPLSANGTVFVRMFFYATASASSSATVSSSPSATATRSAAATASALPTVLATRSSAPTLTAAASGSGSATASASSAPTPSVAAAVSADVTASASFTAPTSSPTSSVSRTAASTASALTAIATALATRSPEPSTSSGGTVAVFFPPGTQCTADIVCSSGMCRGGVCCSRIAPSNCPACAAVATGTVGVGMCADVCAGQGGPRAVPAAVKFVYVEAGAAGNSLGVDVIMAGAELCARLAAADSPHKCAAAGAAGGMSAGVGSDGEAVYFVGTAAEMHIERV